LNESLLIAFIANLTLIFLIFSPVETFHCSPGNWLFPYLAVGILLLCNYFVSKHFTNAESAKTGLFDAMFDELPAQKPKRNR